MKTRLANLRSTLDRQARDRDHADEPTIDEAAGPLRTGEQAAPYRREGFPAAQTPDRGGSTFSDTEGVPVGTSASQFSPAGETADWRIALGDVDEDQDRGLPCPGRRRIPLQASEKLSTPVHIPEAGQQVLEAESLALSLRNGVERGREQHGQRPALRLADDGGPITAGGVHHRPDVVHASLRRRRPGDPVGHAHAPFVEADEPGELTDALEESTAQWLPPNRLRDACTRLRRRRCRPDPHR